MKFKWHLETNIGIVREENQDAIAVLENDNATMAILCDGMGGHSGGKYASNITIKTFSENFQKLKTLEDPIKWFSLTLEKSLLEMRKVSKKEKNKALMDMGTTVVAVIIMAKRAYIFNIGDSRCYYYNGLFHQVTVDQNLRNYLIHHENLSEEHASKIYGGNALTSSLGPQKKTELEIFEFDLDESSKYVILTSDGIHDYLSKPTFESIIADEEKNLEEKTSVSIARAIKGNSGDNLSIIILEIS